MEPSKRSEKKADSRERIVVDTSVLVSSAFGGRPLEALDKARGFRLIVSPAIAAESALVLSLVSNSAPETTRSEHHD